MDQRPAERERERPQLQAALHRRQVLGGPFRALAAGQERHPGQRGGQAAERARRGLGHLGRRRLRRRVATRPHHAGPEHHGGEIHPVLRQVGHHVSSTSDVTVAHRPSDGDPFISTAGSTMGTSPACWQARRVPGQRLRVGPDGQRRGHPGPDPQHRPPGGELRAEPGAGAQPVQQPVQALGDRLTLGAGQRPGTRVGLDAGHDPEVGQRGREAPPVAQPLPQRLGGQDDPADPAAQARGGDQHLPVGAAAGGRGGHPGRGQPPGHGAAAPVGGQDALARCHQGGRGVAASPAKLAQPRASSARAAAARTSGEVAAHPGPRVHPVEQPVPAGRATRTRRAAAARSAGCAGAAGSGPGASARQYARPAGPGSAWPSWSSTQPTSACSAGQYPSSCRPSAADTASTGRPAADVQPDRWHSSARSRPLHLACPAAGTSAAQRQCPVRGPGHGYTVRHITAR